MNTPNPFLPAKAAEYPRGATVPMLFREVAATQPDRPALLWGGGSLTFAELDLASDALAARLSERGIARGALVGVSGERGPNMVISLLATLKAGAAYVPLDPDYPVERLRFLVSDSGLSLILAPACGAEVFADLGPEVMNASGKSCPAHVEKRSSGDADPPSDTPTRPLGGTSSGMSGVRPAPPGAGYEARSGGDADAEDPAYVTYTSGSTGRPKGVVVPHRGMVCLARAGGVFDWSGEQRLLQMTSLSFDLAGFEIWGALLNGCTLVLLESSAMDLPALASAIRAHRVSIANITTSLFHRIVEEDPALLAGVQQFLVGGEVLSPTLLRRFLDSHPGVRIVNAYGPTESTVIATFFPVPPDYAPDADVPIGLPVPGTSAWVCDLDTLEPVAQASEGELWLSGDGLALGYLGRPDLTREKFIVIPWTGCRAYRTGDRVRIGGDGQLHFLGRIDGQVKLRGFRVEPGEVESVLMRHPSVRRAVATVRETGGDQILMAHVIPAGDGGIDPGALRDFLAMELPAHLVPAHIVPVREFPLTAHGKLDAAALPLPDVPSPPRITNGPRSGLETRMVSLWSGVLGEEPGLETNFLEMGGSSLHLAAIHRRLCAALGREFPITDFFRFTTIRALAAHLEGPKNQFSDVSARATQHRAAATRMRGMREGQ